MAKFAPLPGPALHPAAEDATSLRQENERFRAENRRILMEREFPKWNGVHRQAATAKFAFVRDHRSDFPDEALSRVLGVPRSGFYAWKERPPAPRPSAARGSLSRSARLTRGCGVLREHCGQADARAHDPFQGPAPVRAHHPSRHDRPVPEPALAREFHPDRPNTVWAADITCVPTAEGWLSLAVVIDLFFRKVVGWVTADHLRAELPLESRWGWPSPTAGPARGYSTT